MWNGLLDIPRLFFFSFPLSDHDSLVRILNKVFKEERAFPSAYKTATCQRTEIYIGNHNFQSALRSLILSPPFIRKVEL